MALPPTFSNQVYVTVTPLVSGTLTLPDYVFVSPSQHTTKHTVPSMCFLISHPSPSSSSSSKPSSSTRLMFDLGLRSDPLSYIPEIQAHLPRRHPVTHRPSARETLHKNNIPPESISAVLLSHVHWDHHGDPDQFPNATFVVGHGSLDVVAHGMPGRGSHSYFDANLFRDVKVVEMSESVIGTPALSTEKEEAKSAPDGPLLRTKEGGVSDWQPLGPFAAAVDLMGDGSVYAIPAPGHLPGHINLLCRTGLKSWVYLGGDVFHDKRLLTGEKKIATWEEDGHCFCVHVDREEAERSIGRIRELEEICEREGVELEVIVAHDHGWLEENKGRCLD